MSYNRRWLFLQALLLVSSLLNVSGAVPPREGMYVRTLFVQADTERIFISGGGGRGRHGNTASEK